MLVLSRKLNEQIRIGENITVTILRVKGNTVRVGVDAPRSVRVIRSELPPKSGAGAAQAGAEDVNGHDSVADCGAGRLEESTDNGRFSRGPVFAALMQMSTNSV
jgi:carbon storage regulator CsrA